MNSSSGTDGSDFRSQWVALLILGFICGIFSATPSLLANQNNDPGDLEDPLHYHHPDGHRLEISLGFDDVETFVQLIVNAEENIYFNAEFGDEDVTVPGSMQWTYYNEKRTELPAGKGSMKWDLDKVVLSFTEAPGDAITGKGLQGTYRRVRLAERLEFAKKDLAAMAKQMDQGLAELREKLKSRPEQLQDLEQRQTRWLQYRKQKTTLPAFPGAPANIDSTNDEIYLQGMANLTEKQAEFLSIYTSESVPAGQEGSYTDGLGGRLLIRNVDEKGFDFALTTERGMFRQDGKVSGRAIVDPAHPERALFVDTDAKAFVDGKACQIQFSFLNKRIQLHTVNASHYHESGVSFDGEYFKQGDLEDE